jgi:hypothetical protein
VEGGKARLSELSDRGRNFKTQQCRADYATARAFTTTIGHFSRGHGCARVRALFDTSRKNAIDRIHEIFRIEAADPSHPEESRDSRLVSFT